MSPPLLVNKKDPRRVLFYWRRGRQPNSKICHRGKRAMQRRGGRCYHLCYPRLIRSHCLCIYVAENCPSGNPDRARHCARHGVLDCAVATNRHRKSAATSIFSQERKNGKQRQTTTPEGAGPAAAGGGTRDERGRGSGEPGLREAYRAAEKAGDGASALIGLPRNPQEIDFKWYVPGIRILACGGRR